MGSMEGKQRHQKECEGLGLRHAQQPTHTWRSGLEGKQAVQTHTHTYKFALQVHVLLKEALVFLCKLVNLILLLLLLLNVLCTVFLQISLPSL